jgi:cell division transport system permease protein
MKIFSRIGYYIKEGVSSIFTHGFMSFASICVIVACLLIMGSFTLLALNVQRIIGEFEDENIILAFVDDSLDDAQTAALRPQIEAVEHVESVEFISRDEAMESFSSKYDNEYFENLDSTVLAHRYAVYLDDIAYASQVQSRLRSIPGIARVNANLSIARGFITVRNIVASVSLVLIVVLFVISLFIMSNTIKLATFERREEIGIMRMVGATSHFIRTPFVLEGFILGIAGALIAYLAQWGLYELVTEKLVSRFSSTFISTLPFSEVHIPLLIIFGVIGFIVGVGGSSLAIKNYLKV